MRRWSATLLALPLLFGGAASGGDGAPAPAPAPAFEGAFLPKADLRVPEFLAGHPEHDGRGVVVAILDTGVDPGHARLSKTTTGEGKLVDFLDATDDGLVDTAVPVQAGPDGKVLGATGRLLALGAHWKAGAKAFLGRIDARDVFPPDLCERLRARRRDRHQVVLRRAKEAGTAALPAKPGEDPAAAEARRAAEIEARDAFADDLPSYDVLVVEASGAMQAVIDTDADGDLAEERAISDFSVAQEWVTLGDDAELNVGVRPEPDGKRLRLLFDGGGHGTHVAGIVAGYDPADPSKSGLAPGARILAIKVGNSRWGSATTQLAVLRGLDWAGRRGAKVANLSFGGPTFSGDAGTPDAKAADDVVERYGLLCCFSAGNEGPALSTVGSPATARRVLSVGAYVSPATMKASYSQLGPDPGERLFGFSSRGPLPGGELGISVLAPGAAWSTLPSWHLVQAENWNGTSMAAPEVAGAAALLLSGALHDGIPAPPARVIRALTSSARPVQGLLPCEQGAGLVQVDRAFEALTRMKDAPEERELRARVVNPTGVGGGVYDRALATTEPSDRTVRVEVVWPRGTPNERRSAFEKRLTLASDAPFVLVPPRVGLNANGGSFVLRIEPKGLAEGIHTALVRATDPARASDGPELVVPVTVIVPASADARGRFTGSLSLAPGERSSRFVKVPFGASRVRVRFTEGDGPKNLVTAAVTTLDAWRAQPDRHAQSRFTLGPGEEREITDEVLPGTTLEIVAFSHWNQNGPATIAVEAWFEGPVSPETGLVAGPGEDVVLLPLASPLGAFRGKVSARLTDVIERPAVSREVATAPGETLLGGDRLFVSTQRFRLKIYAGENATVVPLGTHALDEQREDARWRVVDPAGRTVKKALIDGPFELSGLPAGDYTVEYETPTWGRAAADAGLTGFEVRRPRLDLWATVHATADLAAEGTGGDAEIDLPAGSARSVALRLPGLDSGQTYGGRVEVKDEQDRLRLSLPLRVDRVTKDESAEAVPAAEDALVSALRASAQEYADDPFADPAALSEQRARANRAADLRPDDLDLAVLAFRLRVAPGRTELQPQAPDPAAKMGVVTKLLAKVDRSKVEDRLRLGRLLALRSALETRLSQTAEAKADFEEARLLLGDADPDLLAIRVEAGRKAGGDPRDALVALRALRDRDPTKFAASEAVLGALEVLGWGIPASAELRRFGDRFPTRGAEFRAHAQKVRAAGGNPAPRTLAEIDAGAP